MQIIRGIQKSPIKAVIYGPEGIGKSTFASRFPDPLFIDTEGSTRFLDVARTTTPRTWNELRDQVIYVRETPGTCKTLVIDTADWAEQLCITEVCMRAGKTGIEDFGYGKGYTYLTEEFGKLLRALSEVNDRGINIVLTAHAALRKFEQPDESGAYDRWELKLQKKTAPLLKEWPDMLLFANYETLVITDENGKAKARGGKRVMYTSHHPVWDAKNRFGLPEKLDFDFNTISHLFQDQKTEKKKEPEPEPLAPIQEEKTEANQVEAPEELDEHSQKLKELRALMEEAGIDDEDVREVVFQKGWYTFATPLEAYDTDFIQQALIDNWEKVKEKINIPF